MSDISQRIRGVYERIPGSGDWWIRWADGSGKLHREKVGPRQLAIDAYRKRKTEVREGKFFPDLRVARVPYGQLFDDFKAARPNHWSKGLLARARAWFAQLPAESVRAQQIEEKLNRLVADGRTPATANRYRAILGAVYSWAIRNGKVRSSPVRNVPLRRENNQRVRFLEVGEERKLRAAIRRIAADREPEFTLSLHTGIRQGELLSLRWEQVDLKRGFLRLQKTKSGRARAVPLNRNARAALAALAKQGRDRISAGHPRWWFEKALVEAGIHNFRWHDLRHTFASRLVMANVNLRTVQELMGHENILMTMRYAHLAPSHLNRAVNRLSSRSKARRRAQNKTGTPTAQARSASSRKRA